MDNELTAETILEIARERYAAGERIRGLPRPAGAPPGAWYSVQRRHRGGVYLFLRWQEQGSSRQRGRSLGRLDNGT